MIKCAGHSAPLAEVQFEKETALMQAPEGVRIGDKIDVGGAPTTGNVLLLNDIPEGTSIYNIEAAPGDGGKFCRASGAGARLISKTPTGAVVLLPSKREKIFPLHCRAAIGIPAGSGRKEKPFLKAGTKHYYKKAKNKRYPNPSGSAQNAVDHPFGNKRTSRKAKQKPVGHNAPAGRKVGKLWPRRTGRKK